MRGSIAPPSHRVHRAVAHSFGAAGPHPAAVEVVVLHPGALPIEVYKPLAALLPPSLRLTAFDLQSVPAYWGGLDPKAESTTVEKLAGLFLKELQETASRDRPLVLAGWSFGGVIAFELARLLRREGRLVTLVIIDSIAPIPRYKRENTSLDESLVIEWFAMYLGARKHRTITADANVVAESSTDEKLNRLLLISIEAGAMHSDTSLSGFRKVYQSFHQGLLRNNRIVLPYEPRPERMSAVLIKAQRSLLPFDRTLGWNQLIKGRLVRWVSRGDHYTLLTDPAAIRELAGYIITIAERIQGENSGLFKHTWQRFRSALFTQEGSYHVSRTRA